eukprot:5459501-Pyramimonas_sp.AAC.1
MPGAAATGSRRTAESYLFVYRPPFPLKTQEHAVAGIRGSSYLAALRSAVLVGVVVRLVRLGAWEWLTLHSVAPLAPARPVVPARMPRP